MFRLLALASLTALIVSADTMTFTSCTQGSTTVSPCGGNINFPGGIMNAAEAAAEASDNSIVPGILSYPGVPITNGNSLSAAAVGIAYGNLTTNVSVTAQASASQTYYTNGPMRPGFITFDVAVDHLHGGDSTASISDGTNSYNFDGLFGSSTPGTKCTVDGCVVGGTFAIELGVPIQFNVSADVGESATAGGTNVFHGSDDASIVFSLSDASGAPVTAFVASPEPTTLGLLALAFLFAAGIAGTRFAVSNRFHHRVR